MRRYNKTIAMLAAVATVLTGLPTPVVAAEVASSEGAYIEEAAPETDLSWDGYKEDPVFVEEFEGDSINTEVWNIEAHEPGWVNKELQSYVDEEHASDALTVSDGTLKITPTRHEVKSEGGASSANLIDNSKWLDSKGWDASTSFEKAIDGSTITLNISNPGTDNYHVRVYQGLELENGKKYKASFSIKSNIKKQIGTGLLLDGSGFYGENGAVDWGNQKVITLDAGEETPVEITFTKSDDASALFVINAGKFEGETLSSDENTIVISNVSVTDAAAKAAKYGDNLIKDPDFTEGLAKWNPTYNWGVEFEGKFSCEIKDKTAVLSINDVGDQAHIVRLQQDALALEAGKKYAVSFDVKSSVARQISSGILNKDGMAYNEDGELDWGNVTTKDLLADEKTSVEYVVSVPENTSVNFAFNAGKMYPEMPELPEHTIELSNIKVAEIIPDVSYSYTSGRINTQNKKTFTYGRFEARAKVPAGQGYLPAFWLMANDENIYGQWPRCGEIDCMEVKGQDPNKVYGTIHYGNPHSESQGTKIIDGDFSEDFHTFTCDWEPGKITWYVDGIKYHEESDWHSTTEGVGTLTYPAPFDQPFYIILNLAVGGSWVGNPDDATSFDNNPYVIDYVKVYQKESYDEDVERPAQKPVEFRPADDEGNYLLNGNFDEEDLEDDEVWMFRTAASGEGTAAIKDNAITIKTANAGTETHSIQLYQENVPLLKGATYEVKFDAKASEERSLIFDVKGGADRGWKAFLEKTPTITTENQTFTYEFTMTDADYAGGRFEFNLGKNASTADVTISNASIKMVAGSEEVGDDGKKNLLSDGNYIYNGKFQEGKGYLGNWDITMGSASSAKVTGFEDGRMLEVKMPEEVSVPFVLAQNDLAFEEGTQYALSFTAATDKDANLNVSIGGKNKIIPLSGNGIADKKQYKLNIPKTAKFANRNISFTVADSNVTVKLDDIKLMEAGILTNGIFNAGMTAWSMYSEGSSYDYVIDSLNENNAFSATIKDTGDADYKIQLIQYVKLEQGKKYRFAFDAKSTIDRQIQGQIQHDPSKHAGSDPDDWENYAKTTKADLTSEYQTFEYVFTMDRDTDEDAKLNFCLGAPEAGKNITEQHTVVIDNVVLEEVVEDVPGEGEDEPSNEQEETVCEIPDYSYTGSQIKPVVTVYDGDKLLKLGTDYTVTYKNNINVNAVRKQNDGMGDNFNEALPYVIVKGKGDYSGEHLVNFNITHMAIANRTNDAVANVVLAYEDQLVQNTKNDQQVFKSLKVNKKNLTKGKDFDIAVYFDGETEGEVVKAGKSGAYTLKVTGKGNYTGTIVVKGNVVATKAKLIKNTSITLGSKLKKVPYTGKNITLQSGVYDAQAKKYHIVSANGISSEVIDAKEVFVVKAGSDSLEEGKDFVVNYSNNKSVGKATMTIVGMGDYVGSKSVTFDIVGSAFKASNVIVTGLDEQTYTGSAIKLPSIRVNYKLADNKTKPLIQNNHYRVEYKKNVNKGTATVTFIGNENAGYTGKFSKTFKIVAKSIEDEGVVLSKNDITVPYSKAGSKLGDNVKLTWNGIDLVEGKDYKVAYSNNKAIGTNKAEATITGTKNFTGKKVIKFSITPAELTQSMITVAPISYKGDNAKADTTYKLSVKVIENGKTLRANTDYVLDKASLKQSDIKAFFDAEKDPAKKPTVTVTAKEGGNYIGSVTLDVTVYKNTLSSKTAKVIVSSNGVSYTGKQLKPEVRVYDITGVTDNADKKAVNKATTWDEIEKIPNVKVIDVANYDVLYGSNIKSGRNKGSVNIVCKGYEYGGSVTVKFNILQRAISR